MPHLSIVHLVALTFLTLSAFGAGEEAKCRQWALEDGVPAAQMADYVRECVADQAAHPEPRPITGDEGNTGMSPKEAASPIQIKN
jgi:hypothetical protein